MDFVLGTLMGTRMAGLQEEVAPSVLNHHLYNYQQQIARRQQQQVGRHRHRRHPPPMGLQRRFHSKSLSLPAGCAPSLAWPRRHLAPQAPPAAPLVTHLHCCFPGVSGCLTAFPLSSGGLALFF